MRRRLDPYTKLLPFEQVDTDLKEMYRNLILARLGRFLQAGKTLPRRSPLIRLMPALNSASAGELSARFTELEAAEILTELGAEVEPNPFYTRDANFRVSIPLKLQLCALKVLNAL